MKTLKLFRLLSMIAGLACFMIHCLPEANGEAGYDWMMIAVLGLCATGLIVGLGTLWMNLAFTFATLYNLFNAIILYKAKKAYDSQN